MALSAEEIATAKKAYREMHAYDANRVFFNLYSCLFLLILLLFGISFACGVMVDDHGKNLRGWEAFLSFLSFFKTFWLFPLIMLSQLITNWRHRFRYADSRRFIAELEQKHAGELPYGLENEVYREPPKKAILWRLDHFLSRKPITD